MEIHIDHVSGLAAFCPRLILIQTASFKNGECKVREECWE